MKKLICLIVLFVLTTGCGDESNREIDTSQRVKPSAEVLEAMTAEMDAMSGDSTME